MVDYGVFSREELLRELELLNEAYHKLAQEAQKDRLRLQIIERKENADRML